MPGISALLLLSTIHPAHAAWTHDVINGGLPIATGPYAVSQTVSLPDGAGGVFLAWSDQRSAVGQIYAQHVSSSGAALWTAGGVLVNPTATAFGQVTPTIDTDGSGGIFIAWSDQRTGNYDIYAQHLTAAGAVTWGNSSALVTSFAGDQTVPSLVSDDAGGAYICWVDSRPSAPGIYYNHLYANGSTQMGTGSTYALAAGPPAANPHFVKDGNGGAIAVWQQGSANFNIMSTAVVPVGGAWGTVVCSAVLDQITPSACSDGVGGILVAWADKRANANGDIYAQRVSAAGTSSWTSDGVLVSTGTTTHANPQIVSDGVGGAIITWGDTRPGYTGPVAQRISAAGLTLWTSGGVPLSSGAAATALAMTSVAPDGLGGLLVSYIDYRSGSADTWAQRLNSAGLPQWGATGVAVNVGAPADYESAICRDGRGGAIVAFVDGRNGVAGSNSDLFASHLDSYGIMGAEPAIASVKDVPNDNGGHVKVSWYASPLEADLSSVGVSEYFVFRSAPPNVAAAAIAAGRITTSPGAVARADASSRPLLAQPNGANTYFWELVATQNAYHLPTYSVVAPTTGDSMGIGNPKTAFLVEAHNWSNGDYWTSAPDSGYSTDNVPPIVPAPFAGTYSAGAAALHWNPNPEADLANYRLYRGTTPAFVANAGSLLATPADTGFVDHSGSPYYYKLSAVDIHGNESPAAALLPQGTLGVSGPATPRELALAAPSPNPARGTTRIAFELPRAAHVRVTVFDAGGRRVRTLADGPAEAGARSLVFDLRDDRGRPLGAGLYLVRLEAEGRSITRRFAAVR
jgi:hypothetical protein